MGCNESKDLSLHEQLRARFPKTLSVLELQQYSRRLSELFLEFEKGTLTLSLSEFLALCKAPRNRVTERLFQIFDVDGTGSLDFRELCILVWQVCTLSHAGLVAMLFDVYDEFNNGIVEFDDVQRLLGDAYGAANLSKELLLEMIEEVKKKGVLTRHAFADFCERTPQVVKQLMDVQKTIRANVLGTAVWARLEAAREHKTDPVFRAENWASLFERIIIMDIDSREERERRTKELEKKLGRHIKRVNVKGTSGMADEEATAVRYEP